MPTAKEKWKPVGVDSLEPAAEEVLRGEKNTLVYAGPGAGKTELLAQRACFLLQTDECPEPRRILAISFKRDAAKTLRERVTQRSGRTLASRFDSYTFESFSKGIVDRFVNAFPAWCRPKADYRVLTTLNEKMARQYAQEVPQALCNLSVYQRQALDSRKLWSAFVSRPLPVDGNWVNTTIEEHAASALWQYLTIHGDVSALGFPMIGRMAELLLRTNPMVLEALRKSYHFVFLDEFQDTTAIQYELVRTAFKGSNSILTAVGDDKQRIMMWAGAMKGVFSAFIGDFGATAVPLKRNYRSVDKLVKIQAVIAKSLNPDAAVPESMDDGAKGLGECRVLAFKDEDLEATQLARLIKTWVFTDGLRPRDICVLCRMKAPIYTQKLRNALAAKPAVRSRIENEMQDLLSEPLTQCLLDFLKLACRERELESWARSVALLVELRGDHSDEAARFVVDRLMEYLKQLNNLLEAQSRCGEEVEAILKSIMAFVGETEFRALNPQYAQRDWYEELAKQVIGVLVEARNGRNWSDAIDEVEGIDSVPIMTVHKSKGLEFHTIVFVGLEDGAHFSYQANATEETCGFFVALSRAATRVVFTFAGVRSTARGGGKERQQVQTIKPLYDLLTQAGIRVESL